MPKIAFIGAGSFGFTRKLVKDILTFPLLEGSEIALMDINAERLDFRPASCEPASSKPASIPRPCPPRWTAPRRCGALIMWWSPFW